MYFYALELFLNSRIVHHLIVSLRLKVQQNSNANQGRFWREIYSQFGS